MGSTAWESAVTSILSSGGTNSIYILQNIVPLIDYINTIRPILAPIEMCRTAVTWCTHSYDEKEKCDVLKTVAFTSGIYSNAYDLQLGQVLKHTLCTQEFSHYLNAPPQGQMQCRALVMSALERQISSALTLTLVS